MICITNQVITYVSSLHIGIELAIPIPSMQRLQSIVAMSHYFQQRDNTVTMFSHHVFPHNMLYMHSDHFAKPCTCQSIQGHEIATSNLVLMPGGTMPTPSYHLLLKCFMENLLMILSSLCLRNNLC